MTKTTNKQKGIVKLHQKHSKTFNVFHNSINELRDYFGWTTKELTKYIKEHFEILDKMNERDGK